MDGLALIGYAALAILTFIFLVGAIIGDIIFRLLLKKRMMKYNFGLVLFLRVALAFFTGIVALEVSARIFGNQSLFFNL